MIVQKLLFSGQSTMFYEFPGVAWLVRIALLETTAFTHFNVAALRRKFPHTRCRISLVVTLARRLLVTLIVASFLPGCDGSPSTSKLLDDVNSSEEHDRLVAVRLLQNRRADPNKMVPALVKLLGDPHADIRRSAAIGLGHLGPEGEAAIPGLRKAKTDPDRRVRDAASVAILRIEGKNR